MMRPNFLLKNYIKSYAFHYYNEKPESAIDISLLNHSRLLDGGYIYHYEVSDTSEQWVGLDQKSHPLLSQSKGI